jgi:hypothetical protein
MIMDLCWTIVQLLGSRKNGELVVVSQAGPTYTLQARYVRFQCTEDC